MTTWQKDDLENCLSTIIDYRGKTPTKTSHGIPLITAKVVKNGRIDTPNEFIAEDNYKSWMTRGFPKLGDVILTTEAPLGEVAQISDERIALAQRIILLRGKENYLDNTYLKYYLISDTGQSELSSRQTGTTVFGIKQSELRKIKVSFPSFEEQKAIAKILSSLDDKIELNRRMNATLEAMARALFKAWFVDFEPVHANKENRPSTSTSPEIAQLFPSDFENGIPKGWEERGLDGIANFLNGLALQKYPPESDEEFLPVIKIAQLRKGNTEGSDRASKNLRPEYIVNDGDVLFSWSGSLEVEIWCGGDGALNQHLFKVTSEKFPKWFYFLWTRFHLDAFRNIAAHKATTMGHIQRHHLREAKVRVPDPNLLKEMNTQFEPLVAKLVSNALESKTLSAIRDSLLPRLISGKLQIAV